MRDDPSRSREAHFPRNGTAAAAHWEFDWLRHRFDLTEKQAAVAVVLLRGLSYAEAGAELGLSVHTVHSHVKAINLKTRSSSTRRLLAFVAAERARRASPEGGGQPDPCAAPRS